jgi:LPXTG-motif cell wall-anchored protein
MSFKIRAAAITVATSLVAVPLALSGTAFAQDEKTGYIGGTVFNDLNGDGKKQDGEPGIPNVDVMVKGSDGKSYPYASDNFGNWFVKRTPLGQYEVSYTDPKLANTTPSSLKVELGESGGVNGVDFGVRGGSICGIAWKDTNEDGKHQAGEPVLSGRQIFAEQLDRSVVSGADGVYCFDNVPAGDYTLRADGKTGDPNVLTKPGGDSRFDWISRTAQVKVDKGEQVKGVDSGYIAWRPDLKAVQLLIDHGGVTDNNTFKVGDVFEVYGSVVANGNAPQGLTGTLTLPEGLRILAPVGGLSPKAIIAGQQVKLPFGPWKEPGLIEFLGARVVVEKEFTAGEIKWTAEGYTTGVEGGFPDVDPSNNVLTRKINAVAAQPQPQGDPAPKGPEAPEVKTAALANTGADPVAAGAVGLGALALGGLALFAARRRRNA